MPGPRVRRACEKSPAAGEAVPCTPLRSLACPPTNPFPVRNPVAVGRSPSTRLMQRSGRDGRQRRSSSRIRSQMGWNPGLRRRSAASRRAWACGDVISRAMRDWPCSLPHRSPTRRLGRVGNHRQVPPGLGCATWSVFSIKTSRSGGFFFRLTLNLIDKTTS